MNILELSQTRFSARKYTDEAVSDDDLHISSSASDWLRRLLTANRGSLSLCAARRLRNSFGKRTTAIGSALLRSTSCA